MVYEQSSSSGLVVKQNSPPSVIATPGTVLASPALTEHNLALQNKQLFLKLISKYRRERVRSVSSLPVLHRLQSAAGQVGVQQIAKDLDVGHRSPVHLWQEETTWFSLGTLLCSWFPPLLSDTFL